MKALCLYATLALAVLTPRRASADDPFLLGSDEDESATAAATRGLERPQDAPGFLVIVYERDIAERGYRTLADLLADVHIYIDDSFHKG